jgi:hypothetical protein
MATPSRPAPRRYLNPDFLFGRATGPAAGAARSGTNRGRAFDRFDPDRYHRRSAVETTFSITKRRWGGRLTARERRYRRREMKLEPTVHALEWPGTIVVPWSIRPLPQSPRIDSCRHDRSDNPARTMHGLHHPGTSARLCDRYLDVHPGLLHQRNRPYASLSRRR